jgi:acyl-CoA synthetase (AMP-forming)/AMP-acid ligase II
MLLTTGHLYGSSEAEPVAVSDAKMAVKKSREKNYFQTLSLGKPISFIQSQIENSRTWVTGPHVCPLYLGNDEENKLYKRKDEKGLVWHDMGDRVLEDPSGNWWYAGRSSQKPEDFKLEQDIYYFLKSSLSFVHRDKAGKLYLCGEKITNPEDVLKKFSILEKVVNLKIKRDSRHRARIDRMASLKKGAPWLLG